MIIKVTVCVHTDEGFRYMNIFISTWVLLVAGLIFALPMIYMRVTDTTEEDELYALLCLSPDT